MVPLVAQALDLSNPELPVTLELLHGDTHVGSVPAGFTVMLPAGLHGAVFYMRRADDGGERAA